VHETELHAFNLARLDMQERCERIALQVERRPTVSNESETPATPAEQERIGGLAGLAGGVLTGARIGSAVLPVAGVGTFAGAVVGGIVGNEVGKRLGRAVVNGFSAFTKTLTEG
jgi:hypothetical protein